MSPSIKHIYVAVLGSCHVNIRYQILTKLKEKISVALIHKGEISLSISETYMNCDWYEEK